jgi:hypothetical protein
MHEYFEVIIKKIRSNYKTEASILKKIDIFELFFYIKKLYKTILFSNSN